MRIEAIRLRRTIKAGSQVWEEGTVLRRPFPSILLPDIFEGNSNIEVVEYGREKLTSPGGIHFSPTFQTPDMKSKIVPGVQPLVENLVVQRPVLKEPTNRDKPKLIRR